MRLSSTLPVTSIAVVATAFALTACGDINVAQQTKTSNPTTQQTPVQNAGQSITPTPPVAPTDGAARISIADAQKEVENGTGVIVDVRDEPSYNARHIKGAINIPVDRIVARMNELPKDKKIITYCS